MIDNVGEIFLIDWEYAGINYGANDISCILCRYDWTNEQVERYLRAYLGHELNEMNTDIIMHLLQFVHLLVWMGLV